MRASLWVLVTIPAAVWAQSPEPIEFFEKQVRPVLAARCLSCHGAKKQEASLRLDSRDGVLRGGDGGPVVDLGSPGQSRLLQALRHEGDLKMPPAGKLPEREIAVLTRWVELKLPWPESAALAPADALEQAARNHWAFRPVTRPKPPAIQDANWPRSNLDRFVLAKLEANGLRPSLAADRRTWLRRATFDVLGLPPSPEEAAAFEADASPEAVETVVDRLLASPRHGERWGRHWLDVARYADNKGYVFFEEKNYPWAWTYRDYVIGALNADLPYDRFVLEQLAADRLDPPVESRTLTALGFLTLGGHFMNNTHDIVDDRIDVVTRGLMAITAACSRCHDHKYDPIPQADYYALYGVFRSSFEPTVPPLWQPPPDTAEHRQYAAEVAAREQKLVDFVTQKHRELVTGARTRVAEYLLAAYATRDAPPTDDFMLIADKGDINPAMIVRWRVYLEETRKNRDPIWRPWHEVTSGQPISPQSAQDLGDAGLQSVTSVAVVAQRYGGLFAAVEKQWQEALAAARSAGQPEPQGLPDPKAEQLRQVLYGPRSPADAPLSLDWGFLSLFPDRATQEEYKKLLKEVETWAMKGPPRAMVLFDSPRPFEPRVFLRGQPNRLGDPTPRQFLRLVNPDRRPFTSGSGRLELAREIVSPSNPLTARVLVNRVWQHYFGVGLVRTPGDFGLRSDPPSHPELLDWLAADFVEHGWSLKRLHRQILTSATYQQASLDRDDGMARDPDNRLLWKMNRRRLDLEALHDAVLAASENLDGTLGGPSVPPFTGKRRRAVYAYIDRLDLPSLLTTFDFPSPASSSPQRTATTVAPQALFLMNGPFAAEAANRIAGALPQDLDGLYERLFARRPTAEERLLAGRYLGEKPDAGRWSRLVHGLLMTNEFAFLD